MRLAPVLLALSTILCLVMGAVAIVSLFLRRLDRRRQHAFAAFMASMACIMGVGALSSSRDVGLALLPDTLAYWLGTGGGKRCRYHHLRGTHAKSHRSS